MDLRLANKSYNLDVIHQKDGNKKLKDRNDRLKFRNKLGNSNQISEIRNYALEIGNRNRNIEIMQQ